MTENQKPISYEEALKAFKAEWAEKRAQERKEKREAEKEEKRKGDIEKVQKALYILNECEDKNALVVVINRLNMFINGEKFTRTRKGGNK